jgi:hypothetical protein
MAGKSGINTAALFFCAAFDKNQRLIFGCLFLRVHYNQRH